MKVTDAQVEKARRAYDDGLDRCDGFNDRIRAALESLGGVWLSEDDAETAARALRYGYFHQTAQRIEDQLPLKVAEPTGLGAVVEDVEGLHWIRGSHPGHPWFSPNGLEDNTYWANIPGPVQVHSEGVEV